MDLSKFSLFKKHTDKKKVKLNFVSHISMFHKTQRCDDLDLNLDLSLRLNSGL